MSFTSVRACPSLMPTRNCRSAQGLLLGLSTEVPCFCFNRAPPAMDKADPLSPLETPPTRAQEAARP